MNRFEFNSNLIDFKNKQDELAHYGTRGQKWGVRKWQNYDGTFNEAGKERYFGKKSSSESSEKMEGYSDLNNKFIRSQARFAVKHPKLFGVEGLTEEEVYQAYKNVSLFRPGDVTPHDQRRANINAMKAQKVAQEAMKPTGFGSSDFEKEMNKRLNEKGYLTTDDMDELNKYSTVDRWKQLDESSKDPNYDSDSYWKNKADAEKYLDENYDKDFANVIKDDYNTTGEWGDVDAAYEQFKQNPYEYLKKYSRDPKYNLSPKEEKALQKEADKIDKAFAKGDIGTLNLLQSDKTEQIRKEANKSFNKNCLEELNKLKDLYKDYDDDSEYYYALTALANSLVFGNTKVGTMANMIHGYVYDDFDQGSGSSGHVYLLDKGYTKDDMTNMCKTNSENNEKFKNDIDLSISKDPLMNKTNERVKIQLRNALHNGSRSNLINKDAGDYDNYSYRLQESGDTDGDYSNRIKQNLSEAKKILNKVNKTCSSKEYGWWYLNKAIDELGYSDINYKDLTDSDWNKINAKIKELG